MSNINVFFVPFVPFGQTNGLLLVICFVFGPAYEGNICVYFSRTKN